ncbi:MAG: hypothetical protein IT462_17795 [Planctomycetes bacterium]|nr:hypothetical protein [Planctomycetota bacterium]
MKKVFSLMMCLVAFAALSACGGTGSKDGGGDGSKDGGGDGSKCGANCAMLDAAMKPYTDGTVQAQYWVTVHANAEAGQYWETTSKMSGMEYKTKWQVAAKDGDNWIVETTSTMMGQGYVLAYCVDPSKKMEDHVNVLKAWIGKPNGKPTEIKVMEYKDPGTGTATESDWTMDTKTEDFSDVEMGGMKWSGKKTTMTGKHKNGKDWMETTSWTANDGWFGGVIKTTNKGESSGYAYESSTELTAANKDGKPWLSWG